LPFAGWIAFDRIGAAGAVAGIRRWPIRVVKA